jgi:hypothetical protein
MLNIPIEFNSKKAKSIKFPSTGQPEMAKDLILPKFKLDSMEKTSAF